MLVSYLNVAGSQCPIYCTDGIAGLYRGFVISCVGIVVYRGLYFGLYDSLKPALGSYSDNFLATFVLGWGITNLAGLASYPIDTIRRRMMMTSGAAVKYRCEGVCVCGLEYDMFYPVPLSPASMQPGLS